MLFTEDQVKRLSSDQDSVLAHSVWTAIVDTSQHTLGVCCDTLAAPCKLPHSPLTFHCNPTREDWWPLKHLESREQGHNMETN